MMISKIQNVDNIQYIPKTKTDKNGLIWVNINSKVWITENDYNEKFLIIYNIKKNYNHPYKLK